MRRGNAVHGSLIRIEKKKHRLYHTFSIKWKAGYRLTWMAGYRLALSTKWKEKRSKVKKNDRKSLPVTGCRLPARIFDKMKRNTQMKSRLPADMNGRLPARIFDEMKRKTSDNQEQRSKSLPVTGCRLAARICDKMNRSTQMKNRLPVYMNGRLPACIFDQMKRKSDRKSKTTIESRLPAKVNRKTKHRLDRSQFRFHESWLPVKKLKLLLTCWRLRNSCQSCWNRKKMVDAKKWSKMKPMVENNLTTIFWSNMETHFWPLDDF